MDLEKKVNIKFGKTLDIYDALRKEPKEKRIEKIEMYLDGRYSGLDKEKSKNLEDALKLTVRDLNEQERIDIAKKYLEKRPNRTTTIIDWFLITNPVDQEQIAMAIIKNQGPICNNIQKLNIKEEDLRIKIAKEAIKSDIYMVPNCIQNFNITNQKELFEIAKMSVARNSLRVAKNIAKFKIKDEAKRIELAQDVAGVNGRALAQNINNFAISNEDVVISLANIVLKEFPDEVAENVEKFNISSEKERFKLANEIAKNKRGSLSFYIERFNLKNEEYRICLAKKMAHINGSEIGPYVRNYQINDRQALIEILKEVVITDSKCKRVSFKIGDYKIANIADLNYAFNIILSHQDEVNNINIILKRYKGIVKDMLSRIHGFSFSTMAERIRCAKALRNINKFIKLYEDKGELDTVEILGENNSEQVQSIIDSQKDERLKGQSRLIVEKLLFAFENSKCSTKYRSELTKLIVELISIRNLTLKEQLIPLSVKLINENGLFRIREEMQINNKKKAYPAIFAVVFDRLSLYEKEGYQTLDELRKVFSISNVLRDSKVVQNILITLNLLDSTYLDSSQVRNIIQCMIKVPSKIKMETKYISCIIYLNRIDKLENVKDWQQDGMRGIFYEIYKEYMKIDDIQFMDKYEEFLNKKENTERKLEEYIMEYVARKNTDNKLMKVTKVFLETMSDNNMFRKARYDTNTSEHLRAIKQISKDMGNSLYNKWTYGIDVNNMFEEVGSPEELKQGMKKLIDRFDYEQYEYLIENEAVISDDPVDLFLIGTEIDGSCQSISHNGKLNSCLMGYVMDGKNKAIVMKNDKGKIIARSIIRLLIDEQTSNVIMVREKIYIGLGVDESNLYRIDERCVDYAKWLGVSVVCEDSGYKHKGEKYTGTLVSKRCQVPYEYVDIARTYFSDEEVYRVSNENLVYIYNHRG